MTSALKQLLPAKVVLGAALVATAMGLLFEGIMIGPEYQRHKPPCLVLLTLVLFAVLIAWFWWRAGNGDDRGGAP